MTQVLEIIGNEIWVEVSDKLFVIDLRGADAESRTADTTIRFSRPDRSRTVYLRDGKDDEAISAVLAAAAKDVAAYVDAFLTIQPNGGEDARFYA